MKNHQLISDFIVDFVPGALIMAVCDVLIFLPPEFWTMGLFLDVFGVICFSYQLSEAAKHKKRGKQGRLEDHSEKMIGDKKPTHEVVGQYEVKERQK